MVSVRCIYVAGAGRGATENAGVEKSGEDRRGGKCRSRPI